MHLKQYLRLYQIKCLEDIRQSLGANQKIIFCLPTGGGKSLIFTELCKNAINKGTTVLILTESRKLFKQIQKDIHNAIEIKAGSKLENIEEGRSYIAMAQSLIRRKYLLDQFAALGKRLLVIADEIHISTPVSVIRQLPDAYHLGVTATPNGPDSPHLKEIYKDIVIGPQTLELIALGFLAPYRHFMRDLINPDKFKIKAGEYTIESQTEAFQTTEVFSQLCTDLRETPYKKCMIFCSSISHAEIVAEQLNIVGFNCITIHSETGNNLDDFINGPINICISVGMLTKGFDMPAIDLCILFRATTSLSLYFQMIGRASRINKPVKTGFIVLDYGSNGLRHGLWNGAIDWATKWKEEKKPADGVAASKMCPECFYLMAANASECPACGYIFEKNIKEKTGTIYGYELKQFTIGEFDNRDPYTLRPEELAFLGTSKGRLKAYWDIALHLDNFEEGYLKAFGKAAGYNPKWWKIFKRESEKSIIVPEKVKEKAKKLQVLAERGIDGEAINAAQKLAELMQKYKL